MHNMEKRDTYLIIAAVVICIVISCLSPYIASGDPDGLEKSALDSNRSEDFVVEEINGIPAAIFPDYAGESPQIVQIAVLILGAVITLVLGYVVAEIVKNRRN